MKALVTGGAGFIGSHIIDFLIDKGYQVAIIDNLSTGKKENLNPKAVFYEKDIRNNLDEVFEKEKPDIVIHTAAQVMLRKSLKEPKEDASINIIGTINILEACKKANVKKIIYTATGGARYGEPEKLPVNENQPIRPTAPYGISKHTAEHYVWMYGKNHGIENITFCFGNVYGPRDDPKCKRVTSIFAWQMLNNETPHIYGDGNQTRDFIYVKDLAKFIVDSIDKQPEHNLFNLANGKQISVNQIFNILKEFSGFEREASHDDAIPGEVRDIVLDCSLAEKELGWNPEHDFRQGLEETWKWFKENYGKDN